MNEQEKTHRKNWTKNALKTSKKLGKFFSDLVENGTSIINKVLQSNQTEVGKATIQKEDPNLSGN